MAAPKLAEAQRPAMVAHSQAEHPQPDQHQEFEKAAAKKSKILVLQNSSPKLSGESERSASEEKDVSVVSTQEISSTSSGMVTPQKLHPKDGKIAGCKRPASCVTPRKKPAMAPKSAKTSKPAKAVHMATHNTWVASCSFGWLKMGSFKEKGYIQARNGSDSKPYCLVNVNLPKGDDQTKVLEACFAEAQKPDLDKAHMVNFKNHVLKQLWGIKPAKASSQRAGHGKGHVTPSLQRLPAKEFGMAKAMPSPACKGSQPKSWEWQRLYPEVFRQDVKKVTAESCRW